MADIAELLAELAKRRRQKTLEEFVPYGYPETLCPDGSLWKKNGFRTWSNKPWQTEFLSAGRDNSERLLLAANGVGKTLTGGYETAIHLTGLYPKRWDGFRFTKPITAWVGSISNDQQRLGPQPALLGADLSENLGTGFIPGDRIIGKVRIRQAGVAEVADMVKVKWTGPDGDTGASLLLFKTYQQGWRIWQSGAPNLIWGDEQPDENESNERPIFPEMQTRVFRSNGIMIFTLTPLLGETDLISHFIDPKAGGIFWTGATWDDAPHLDEEQCARLVATYPEHEREARTKGIPMLGEGAVFTVPEEDIKCSPFPVPQHFAWIKGVDFGIDHPAAVADIAWDRDSDVIYVTRVWRKKGAEAEEHAEAINAKSRWIPVAWPHDGTNREKGSGVRLKDIYVDLGVRMLSRSARYKNDRGGSQPVEPIIQDIEFRARNGGFKVFDHCREFFEEYRNYHRKEGKIVARKDDVLKAVFYGVMMRRYAMPAAYEPETRQESAPVLTA